MNRGVAAWTILWICLVLGCGRDSTAPPEAGNAPDASSASLPGDLDSERPDRPSPPREPMAHKYEMTLVSSLMIQGPEGEAMHIAGDTGFVYTWQCAPGERVLVLHSHRMNITIDGRPQTEALMERSRFYCKRDGDTTDVALDKAPQKLRSMLRDSYETPLCRLAVDEDGNVKSETVTAGAGAEVLIKNGTIANCRLLHPPFCRGKRAWRAPAKITIGEGCYATGDLIYRAGPARAEGDAAGRIPVEVSGTLTGAGTMGPTEVRNARYVVHGRQTFDPARGHWVDGSLAQEVSMDTYLQGKKIASNSGTMNVSLKWLGSTRLDPAPDADAPDEPPGGLTKDIAARTRRIVAEQLGLDESKVAQTSTLAELGADELDVVELVMELEDDFDVTIPDKSLEAKGSPLTRLTVRDLVEIVRRQVRSKPKAEGR